MRGGNLLTGALSAARRALLPYLAFQAQKHMQKRVTRRRRK
jgi:hypothetical protein